VTEPRDNDVDDRDVTPEVGDEGGTAGDVEVGVDRGTGVGSEATETWRPHKPDRGVVVGPGRRSP